MANNRKDRSDRPAARSGREASQKLRWGQGAMVWSSLVGKQTFFIADTHFDHARIIEYCNRPFVSVEAMNQTILQSWNNIVTQSDTVWFLGDFAFANASRINELLSLLHGEKHLILGNHDKVVHVEGWASVHKQAEINLDGNHVFLYHYPLREWNRMWCGGIHLYGHVHGTINPLPGSMDVGWDVWRRPITLKDIMRHMKPFNKGNFQKVALRFIDSL